jgi:hypothetical protein
VDNGTQFDAETFKDFCDQIVTKIHFASVRHPESNRLVERANGIIMTGIMKLIFNQPRGKWPDELIKVVWSHVLAGGNSISGTCTICQGDRGRSQQSQGHFGVETLDHCSSGPKFPWTGWILPPIHTRFF